MQGLAELRAANERAAERELAQLRSDTIRGLRYVYRQEGVDGVAVLMAEAVPELFAMSRRKEAAA